MLKELIENDRKPKVFNCSSCSDVNTFTLGDLEDLGWMEKRYVCDYEGNVDEIIRKYFGPKAFFLCTYGVAEPELIKPNSTIF
jgi:hypothetical protein